MSFTGALREGRTEEVREYLKGGSDPNSLVDEELGVTALMVAAQDGQAEIAELLMSYGADLEARDASENTALHHAASANKAETVRALLGRGADPNARDGYGLTALSIACVRGSREVASMLIEAGAVVRAFQDGDEPLLGKALRCENMEVARLIMESLDDDDINARDESGNSLLMYATGNIEIARGLVDRGIDVNCINVNGMTALARAAASGKIEVVELLLKNGADPNVNGVYRSEVGYAEGNIALNCALYRGHNEIYSLLRKYGARSD